MIPWGGAETHDPAAALTRDTSQSNRIRDYSLDDWSQWYADQPRADIPSQPLPLRSPYQGPRARIFTAAQLRDIHQG